MSATTLAPVLLQICKQPDSDINKETAIRNELIAFERECREQPQTVDFGNADIDRLEHCTLICGVKVECGHGRRIEIWRIIERPGYCIRIFRPTNDGKTSRLEFGLTPDAVLALEVAMFRQARNSP